LNPWINPCFIPNLNVTDHKSEWNSVPFNETGYEFTSFLLQDFVSTDLNHLMKKYDQQQQWRCKGRANSKLVVGVKSGDRIEVRKSVWCSVPLLGSLFPPCCCTVFILTLMAWSPVGLKLGTSTPSLEYLTYNSII